MAKETLRQLMASLHEELGSIGPIDEESRKMLQQLLRDLEGIASADSRELESHETATGQLENAALKLESDYPKLSMILGDIMDALGKLGI